MKIIIPSLGRSDVLDGVLDFIGRKNVTFWVKQHEVDDYTKVVGEKMVVSVPEEKIGLGAIRNYIVEQNKDEDCIIILDDDVIGVTYRFSDKMETITDSSHFREILENSRQVSEDLGTPLFGYAANQNPAMYTQLDHFTFSGNLPSCHGIIPKLLGDIQYDPRLIVMNDYDIALQCKYYKRFLFLDKRYNLIFSGKWFNKGGSSTLRTMKTLQDCSEILQKKYGKKIVSKNPNKPQYNIKFPF